MAPDSVARAAGPDEHGYFSLGTNADYAATFIGQVPFFLEVTDGQPFTHGENQIHISQLAGWIRSDAGFPAITRRPPAPQDEAIAGHIAEMIPNGACLQVGVGSIPDALLSALSDHRDLGIHTEALSDGLMNLVDSGVATGTRKQQHRNKHVATSAVGTPTLLRWLDHNAAVEMMPVDWTNAPRVVANEPNFVSINATTEVDLMGQAASEPSPDATGHPRAGKPTSPAVRCIPPAAKLSWCCTPPPAAAAAASAPPLPRAASSPP